MSQTIQFHQILEMIDNLSCDEQDDLISIIRHRGNIDDIIAELNND